MKKILAFITAIAMIMSFTACEDKKEDTPEIPEEIIQETAEIPFRELSDADFTDIDANINVTENSPMFELHTIEIDDIDFGEKMSPCKAEDVREQFITVEYYDEEMQEQLMDYYEKICSTPYKGQVVNYTMGGGKIFFDVNYDNFDYRHCGSIYSYDMETGETKELAAFDSLEGKYFNSMLYVNDMLLIEKSEVLKYEPETGERELSGTVYRVDTEKGGYSELFTGDFDFCIEMDGHLVAVKNIIVPNQDVSDRIFYEYDFETGELNEAYRQDNSEASVYTADNPVYYKGELMKILEERERHKISVVTSDYRIDTDLRNVVFAAVSSDMVSIITNDKISYINNYTLYTYNLSNMERCIIKLDGLGTNFEQIGNNIISVPHTSGLSTVPVYFIMPDICTAFSLFRTDNILFQKIGNTMTFLDNPKHAYFDELEVLNSNTEPRESRETVFYWFELD